MKVKDLIAALSELDPEEQVCALVYDKSIFTFGLDEDENLTDEAWEKVVESFDGTD